jgi:hypothetical protein
MVVGPLASTIEGPSVTDRSSPGSTVAGEGGEVYGGPRSARTAGLGRPRRRS